jgi:hypothetical protein
MVVMRAGGTLVLGTFAFAFAAACYAPAPQPGAPCTNGACPSGLVCAQATQTCELRDSTADAGDETLDDAAPHDAAQLIFDAPSDARSCFGGGIVQVCLTQLPSTALSITSNTNLDTDTSPLCDSPEGAHCVVAATDVMIANNRRLRAIGTRPLVIVATGAIVIDGTIDVSGGAGANPTTCVAPAAATSRQGGAGGSWHGRGGTGGGVTSGLGPTAAAATNTVAFRGGCRGGDGAGNSFGTGGSGGGALYLIGQAITINDTLNASGDGGGGATNDGGGGGGGAGGFIGLDAPTVTIGASGRVFANGGGGGEGGTDYKDGNGGGASGGPTSSASGGSGWAPKGGNGGNGSSGTALDGNNGSAGGSCGRNSSSGGGGGGGAGFVYVYPAQTLGGAIAPPVQ